MNLNEYICFYCKKYRAIIRLKVKPPFDDQCIDNHMSIKDGNPTKTKILTKKVLKRLGVDPNTFEYKKNIFRKYRRENH